MYCARLRSLLGKGLFWLACAMAGNVQGGGSGLNVVVVLNQSSSNSLEVANYYCERRGVPPENVLRLNWPLGSNSWSSADFQTNLLYPLLNLLASRPLTNQASFVVLSMDIPFQTVGGTTVNSTTAALFYGLRGDSSSLPVASSYTASESAWEWAKPTNAPNGSFLTTMLTGNSAADARRLVDQGVTSDGTFPLKPVVLAKSSDVTRNIRYLEFDNAALNASLRGAPSLLRTNTDSLWTGTNFLGYETGLASFTVPANGFVPGAMADSLSSYGGDLFDPSNSQTTLLAFVAAGAAGSYGTVSEPGTDPQKFPDPQAYFYQGRGFSLAESYYQSVSVPYLGLVVAEPLAAPFGQSASGRWSGVVSNTPLSGTVPLSVQFSTLDGTRPLAQLDLFVDGQYYRTLTNVTPGPGNVLTVALNNYPVSYTVPSNSTLPSIAVGLAALLNAPSNYAATRVAASAHGDRIELQSYASNYFASAFYYPDTTSQASTSTSTVYRADYVTWPLPPVLGGAGNPDGSFRVHLDVPVPTPYTVLASADLVRWVPLFTNAAGTSMDFLDGAAAGLPSRFYRTASTVPYNAPRLSSAVWGANSGFRMHVDSPTLLPYVVQSSGDLQNWTAMLTNVAGGALDVTDVQSTNLAARFYRVLVLPEYPGAIGCAPAGFSAAGAPLVRIDGAQAAYVVESSTSPGQWTPIFTNTTVGGIQTTAGSSAGGASVLSTYLAASRPAFMNIDVQGYCPYFVLGPIQTNAWLQLNITKTNGAMVSIAVTNVGGSSTLAGLASQLCAAINTNAALQGADGVAAEDYVVNPSGTPNFNLRARSAGLAAAALSVAAKHSGVSILPSGPIMLTNNLANLHPRNHVYVSTGVTTLGAAFALDTSSLADGFHNLTAVAYEGTSVRMQSRATVFIQVTNSPLAATLTLLDVTNSAPVAGSYHLQVNANTNTVSLIRLFSTGGMLGAATNQASAIFGFDGAYLGAGLHPFYALVDTSNGREYRTQTQSVRLY